MNVTPELFDENGDPIKPPPPTDVRYWVQDGRDFYLFKTEGAAYAFNPTTGATNLKYAPINHLTYPADVMVDLRAAMRWFIDEWCRDNRIIPVCCMEDK